MNGFGSRMGLVLEEMNPARGIERFEEDPASAYCRIVNA